MFESCALRYDERPRGNMPGGVAAAGRRGKAPENGQVLERVKRRTDRVEEREQKAGAGREGPGRKVSG